MPIPFFATTAPHGKYGQQPFGPYGKQPRRAQNDKLTILLAADTGNLGPGIIWVKNTDGSNHAYLEDDFASGCVRGFTDSHGTSWFAHNFLGSLRVYDYDDRNFYVPDGPFPAGPTKCAIPANTCG